MVATALNWFPVEPSLTVLQKFRLIEIAHETSDPSVRRYALDLLAHAMNPMMVVAPETNVAGAFISPREAA